MAEDEEEFFERLKALKKSDPVDLAILAGDICQVGRREALWKQQLARLCGLYKRVLYVPGNHEYYRYSLNKGDIFFEEVDDDPNFANLTQLARGPCEIDGVRFIGDTMWFPDTQQSSRVKHGMSDFEVIDNFEPEVYHRHEAFLAQVATKLKAGDVVVTHHMPLPASISPQYARSPLNPFFMADMSSHLNEDCLPRAWIHGHSHDPLDYVHQMGASRMRVYSNPLGYPHEGANPKFWERVVIDI